MDLSASDILIALGVVELAGCLVCGFFWLRGRDVELPWASARSARPARPAFFSAGPVHRVRTARHLAAAPDPSPEDSGRHHVPDELLHSVTIRLSPDGRARAKVPHPTDQ